MSCPPGGMKILRAKMGLGSCLMDGRNLKETILWINCRVNSKIFLFLSSRRISLSSIASSVKTSLERLLCQNGRTNATNPKRRSRR